MGPRAVRRLLRWLTVFALGLAAFSLLSYSLGAHMVWRFFSPLSGAWWNRHEFWLMEGAASALGMLVGIRAAARLCGRDGRVALLATRYSLVVSALLLVPITIASSRVARPDWTGYIPRSLVGSLGPDLGSRLDILASVGIYSLKTAGFALLAGLSLFGLALGVALPVEGPSDIQDHSLGQR